MKELVHRLPWHSAVDMILGQNSLKLSRVKTSPEIHDENQCFHLPKPACVFAYWFAR
jgi:hypothetical protein